MLVPLSAVVDDHLFRSAKPKLLAGAQSVQSAQVRWVHPSEVVQIAGLLHGNELLLTTGEAVFHLKPEAQLSYLDSLSERGVAALVLEPLVPETRIPERFIEHAQQLGLPLYRLEATVPFVELAEKINRRIVSEQASALQQADEISQLLAKHMASAGPNLRQLLEMIEKALGSRAVLEDLGGRMIAESSPAPVSGVVHGEAMEVATDLFVGSDTAARLVLAGSESVSAERLELVAERLGSIVGLAYAQHYRPSAVQVANTSLLQAIVNGAGGHFVADLARQAQIGSDEPVMLLVFQSYDMARIRGSIERQLHQALPSIRTYLESGRLYALLVLAPGDPRGARREAIASLRRCLAGLSVECCAGPVAEGIWRAHWSLAEALVLESFPEFTPDQGRVRDASDYALERLAAKFGHQEDLEHFIAEQVGNLLQHEDQRGSVLLATLLAWLDAGCNTTHAAHQLYLERQTLHKRLARIFALLGGDPREGGRLLQVHLACRLAMGRPQHARAPRVAT